MVKKKLLIVGAGEAGTMIASEISKSESLSGKYTIAGYLDDARTEKANLDYKILGPIDHARQIIDQYDIDEVLLAIPSAEKDLISKIMKNLIDSNVRIKIIPGFSEIISGDVTLGHIRDFEPSDLLGREEISFDVEKISSYYRNKTIFITGAGGSIGSEIVMQLLALPVEKIVVFGHGENSLHQLLCKIKDEDKKRVSYVIGDVKDYGKLKYVISLHKPDVVFHAAAHKHVPIMEEYPEEALKNNVIGTYNLARVVSEERIKRFVFVSTDKAVNPTSVMGASKRMGEKVVLSFNMLNGVSKFSLVRFGNVLGSRGSVIPIFKSQIAKGGPVTITHEEITRFFMSIREAARLVIKAGTIEQGRIFVLDMGKPVKIVDLAKNMIRLSGHHIDDIQIVYTGLRKGEKLYEELLTATEHLEKTTYDKLFILHENQLGLEEKALQTMIDEAGSVALTHDKTAIKQVIKKYVPEYLEPGVN